MAIAFRAVGTHAFANSGAVSPGIPAGIANNDILVAFVGTGGAPTIAMPAGWTNEQVYQNGTIHQLSVWWKRTTGTESAPSITGATQDVLAFIYAYSGCTTSGDPFDVDGAKSVGTTSPASAPSITPTQNGDMVIWCSVWTTTGAGNATYGTPSGTAPTFTLENQNGQSGNTVDVTLMASDGLQTTAAATGARTATLSQNDNWTAAMLALMPPGSGGATGSAAITEGTDTASGTGSVGVSGSAGITEGADTVAGTGTVGVSGSASITEGADTVSASGTAGASGSAGITEGSDAVSGTGSVGVSGSAPILEGADAVAATGSVGVSGSAAITEGADTVSASGSATTGASGSAGITEGSDTVSASGSIGVSGSAAIIEGIDIVSASGSVPAIGPVMPNVVGLNYYMALEILQDAGIYIPLVVYAFEPSSITVQWAKTNLHGGIVTAQSIQAGVGVKAAQPITLTVSTFPFGSMIDSPPDWRQLH